MAVMAKFNLEIIQLDAINAFVNANLNELMYMRTSPGFPVKNHVLRLNKALYGLQRSPLLWQKELSRALATCGFIIIPQNPCILIKSFVIAFYFVDNIMFYYRKFAQAEAKGAIKNLKIRFKIINLGEIKWFLGLHVLRDRQKRLLWLLKKAYVERVAERFGLAGHISRQPFTLILAKELHPSAETLTISFRNLFQKKMGLVLYAAMQTRPDIAFAPSRFARFNYCSNDSYMTLIDGIIRYLWAIRGYIIRYNGQIDGGSKSIKAFICYNNASFANYVINRKSSQDYIIMLFGGLISYCQTICTIRPKGWSTPNVTTFRLIAHICAATI
jgi:hypothetical protein